MNAAKSYKVKMTPKTLPRIVKETLVRVDARSGTHWYECLLDDGTIITMSIPGRDDE